MTSQNSLSKVLELATHTAYPEPDTPLHSSIIPGVVKAFSEWCKPPASVLDIGCGSCFGAKALREVGYNVTPISILQDEVDVARELGFPAIKCEMHQTDLLGKFDAIWLRHVAEHSPCPMLLLSNLATQADWLYMEVPLPETAAHHETNPNHFSCLTENAWPVILNRCGWKIKAAQIIRFELAIGEDLYLYFICSK